MKSPKHLGARSMKDTDLFQSFLNLDFLHLGQILQLPTVDMVQSLHHSDRRDSDF